MNTGPRPVPGPESVSPVTSVGPQPNPVPQTQTVAGASSGAGIGQLQEGSAGYLLAAMGAHLDAITRVIMQNAAQPADQSVFSIDNSTIGNGVSYKLADQNAISYCVENYSAAYITIVDGPVPGRVISYIPPYSYKVGLLPIGVQVVSLLTSQSKPAAGSYQGQVSLALSTVPLTPTIGTLLGAAIRTDVETASPTVLPGTLAGTANFLVGVVNNSLLAQTVTATVYDSVSSASGPVAASIGPLGVGQIITFPQPVMLLYGAVVQLSGVPNATSIQFLTT